MAHFTFDPKGSSIVLRAVVEGEIARVVSLILDTGFSFTHLPWRVLQAIGYDPGISREKVKVVTPSGVEFPPKVKVKRIRALGKSVKDVDVLCHDLPPEAKVDGLLSLNFLRNFNIAIRFKEGVIVLD
jgi:aspartyl protease family protein